MVYKIALGKVVLAMSFGLAAGVPLVAQSDVITLQIPGIAGDTKFATSNGLPLDSIRVLTVATGVENTGTTSGGGSGTGKAILSNVSIVKKLGESSPALFLQAVRGTHFQNATISFYRMKQGVPSKYYTITLNEIFVRSLSWVGNSSAVDAADAENLELEYSRITLLDDVTGARVCYDVKTLATC